MAQQNIARTVSVVLFVTPAGLIFYYLRCAKKAERSLPKELVTGLPGLKVSEPGKLRGMPEPMFKGVV